MNQDESNKSVVDIAVADLVLAGFLRDAMTGYFPATRIADGSAKSDATIILADRVNVPAGEAFCIPVETPLRLGMLLDRIRDCLQGRDRLIHRRRQGGQTVRFGPYTLMPEDSRLDKDNGGAVRLTEKERDILMLLCEEAGSTVNRADLLAAIWGYADGVETHTLETHIYRLRQKIEKNPAEPDYLLTDGTGYKISG